MRNIFLRVSLTSFLTILMLCKVVMGLEIEKTRLSNIINSSEITSLTQDNTGFLWIGTWNGLYRYNGHETINYTEQNRNVLGRKISAISLDIEGKIWVGTYSEGIYIIEPRTNKISKIDTLSGSRIKNVLTISRGRQGNMLIGTTQGLIIYDKNQDTFFSYKIYSDENGLRDPHRVSAIATIDEHHYWIGTARGLFLFDKSKEHSTRIQDFPNTYIYSLKRLNNSLYIGSKHGLHRAELTSNGYRTLEKIEFPGLHKEKIVTSIIEGAINNQLIIGTQSGHYTLNLGNHTISKDPSFYIGNKDTPLNTLSLAIDNNQILWIGTLNGLYQSDPNHKKFHSIHDPELFPSVRSICRFDDHIIMSSWGEGIKGMHWNSDSSNKTVYDIPFETSVPSYSDFIYESIVDEDQNLWLGTKGAGIYKIKLTENRNQQLEVSSYVNYSSRTSANITDDYCLVMHYDDDGVIWAGTWGGYIYYHTRDMESFEPLLDLKTNEPYKLEYPVRNLNTDSYGNLYAGSFGDGIIKLSINKKFFGTLHKEHLNITKSNYSFQFVLDSYNQNDSILWFCGDGGIVKYDIQQQQHTFYTDDENMPLSVAHSIEVDKNNKIWLSGNKGLIMLEFEEDSITAYRQYTMEDNLPSLQFFPGSKFQTDGQLFYGSSNGFCFFDPDEIKQSKDKPNLQFSSFTLHNKLIKPGDEVNGRILYHENISNIQSIRLKHDENTFTFHFTAFDFSAPEKIKYAYRMEGLDDNWYPITTPIPSVTFNQIPHGKYSLQIKCTNSDQVWSDTVKSFEIMVSPPWWHSNMAYVVYVILFLLALMLARYVIMNRHQLQLKKVEFDKHIELYDMKLKFYTNISHEFRTPLTIIVGMSEFLQKSITGHHQFSEHIERIQRNAIILKRLINDLLDLRKMEKDSIMLNFEQVNIAFETRQLCDNFTYLFSRKAIDFSFENQLEEKVFIQADKLRFESIVYNLLSNAYKFTPSKGTVLCRVHKYKEKNERRDLLRSTKQEYVSISFIDNGKGIPKTIQKRIFERYYGSFSDQQDYTDMVSTGLGLPFAKKLLELHKASIELVSEENQGATFTITFPIESTQPFGAQDESEQSFQMNFVKEIPSETIDKKAPQVLVVDDNEDLRNLVKNHLQSQYQVIEAENGKEGWEKALRFVPDLIISDILMPEMSGIELCNHVKSSDVTNHIPVILLTALPSIEHRIEGLKKGADSYIPKPFDPEHLKVRVAKLMESRALLKNKFIKEMAITPEINEEEASYDPIVEFVNKLKQLVEEHISDPEYKINELCRDIGMSRMQLYRKLKSSLGVSANEFIRMMRMKKAQQLLEIGNLTISEITYEVGFNDLQYFRKCFKEEFGITPSDYLKQHKKE